MNLIRFFINQSKVVNLLVIFLTLWGLYIFVFGQKEGFPNIKFPYILVTTIYPGASPEEIESLITKKIEEAVKSVDGKKEITSTSVEGISTVAFELEMDRSGDIDKIMEDIKNEVDLIKKDLPDDAEDPEVADIGFDKIPVISVLIAGDKPEKELRKIADRFETEAGRIPGVGQVDLDGYRDREIWVEVSAEKLDQYDLQITDVIQAVQLKNINLPGGKIPFSGEEYLIRTLEEFENVDQVKDTIVRANDNGNIVRVKDVAEVKWTYEELEKITRVQGTTGIRVTVQKNEAGDIIRVASAVKRLMEKYKEELPEGVQIIYSDDISFFVERRLAVLGGNAFLGLVLVFCCLILFFDFQTTFWATLGIPVAFCVAMIVADGFGLTLNLMTMFGFIIVVGMLVDDAIIVAENIYRHREMGEDNFTAAVNGTKEVLIPLVAMTATTIGAFLPMMSIYGIMGKFLAFIPKIVVIAMVASFLECLFVMPGHIAHFGGKSHKDKKGKKQSNDWQAKWFAFLVKRYEGILRKLIKRPIIHFSAISLGGFGLVVFLFFIGAVPFVLFPGEIAEVQAKITCPVSYPIEKTAKVIDQVESNIRANLNKELGQEAIRELISTVGYSPSQQGPPKVRTYTGTVRIVMLPGHGLNERKLIEAINKNIEGIEGIESANVEQVRGGPPRQKPVAINIVGPDYEVLKAIASKATEELKQIPNTTSVVDSFEEGKKEIRLEINEKRAAILGVNVTSAAIAIRNAFEGGEATTINSMPGLDEEVKVIVKFKEGLKRTRREIESVTVKNNRGRNIRVDQFARLVDGKSTGLIEREEGERFIQVSSELIDVADNDYNAGTINKIIKEKIEDILGSDSRYQGYRQVQGGDAEAQKKEGSSAGFALLTAAVLVFVVLTGLFRSYIQPVIVMFAIPFAFVGVVFGLAINATPIGLMPMIGMVALTGVVVNDSLILVSFINRGRLDGLNRVEAIVRGGKERLRPIILTTVTTGVGLVPLAYGIFGSEPFLEPMAIALLWGLVFASFVTLFMIPCMYLIVDELVTRVYRLFGAEYKLPGSIE